MIVAGQSTEAFRPHHVLRVTTKSFLRYEKSVVESLVIALSMIVSRIWMDHIIQGAFTRYDHLIEAILQGLGYITDSTLNGIVKLLTLLPDP
jgi:hypothetical protein